MGRESVGAEANQVKEGPLSVLASVVLDGYTGDGRSLPSLSSSVDKNNKLAAVGDPFALVEHQLCAWRCMGC